MTTYTDMQCETAQIVWEVMLDTRKPGTLMDAAWNDTGTYAMRGAARSIALQIEHEWQQVSEDQRDGLAFDWEVVPAVLDITEWIADAPQIEPGAIKALAEKMAANLAARLVTRQIQTDKIIEGSKALFYATVAANKAKREQ